MGQFSVYHWLFVVAILGYLGLLVRIAKPRPTTTPVKDSKTWLRVQTVIARLCVLFFGVLTLMMVAGTATRQEPQDVGDPTYARGYFLGMLIGDFVVLLLFALSVRWKRSVRGKSEALKPLPVVETSTVAPAHN